MHRAVLPRLDLENHSRGIVFTLAKIVPVGPTTVRILPVNSPPKSAAAMITEVWTWQILNKY